MSYNSAVAKKSFQRIFVGRTDENCPLLLSLVFVLALRDMVNLPQYCLKENYLPDLELYFCENEIKVPHSFWLDDRTPAYVEAWYLVELVHRDRDRDKFSVELPFNSPNMLICPPPSLM